MAIKIFNDPIAVMKYHPDSVHYYPIFAPSSVNGYFLGLLFYPFKMDVIIVHPSNFNSMKG